MNEGVEEQKKLEEAGFSPEEIGQWQAETRQKLTDAGFSQKETDQYFGIHTDPDMSGAKAVVDTHMAIQGTLNKAKGIENNSEEGFLSMVKSAFGGFEHGYQNSVTGLLYHGKVPQELDPNNLDSSARIGSQVGQIVGDLPAMIAGGFAAGMTALPTVVGAAPAAAAGAFALPAALRTALVDAYTKGDIQSAGDFMERTSAIIMNGSKEAAIGGASSMIGGKVGTEVVKTALPSIVKGALPAVAELATMTTIAKGAEGHLPNLQDFTDGAIILAGTHAATSVSGKMMNVWKKTGINPTELGNKMAEHPTVLQDLLSDNKPFPSALENYVEKAPEPKGVSNIPEYNPKAALESTMKDMAKELKQAERSQTLIRDESGNVIDRVENNTYPEWYSRVKSGNLEKTMADLQNPNSAASKRLKIEAEQRLTEGYQLDRKMGGYEGPDHQYRASLGLDPHETVSGGKVIHFDGQDGVIQKADGSTVHFDASTVKENFKVGDEVSFTLDKNIKDFDSAEMVFGTKTPEKIAEANLPKEDIITVSDAGEIEVKTPDGGKRPPTAEEKILGHIGERQNKKASEFDFEKLYTNVVDKFNPIKLAVGELKATDLPTNKNPYELARMANDYKAKVKHVFEKGMIDYETLKVTGPSFKEIIEPFRSDAKAIDGLKAFMVSKRALELEARGIKSGFDIEAAKEVVANGETKFGKAAEQMTEFQNGALKYAKDSGLISDKAYKSMLEAGKSYVSFSRIVEPEATGSKAGKSKSLKNIKGSDLMIQDPFKSMVENTEALFRAAEANRSTKALVDLAAKTPDQTVISQVKTKMKPIEVTEAEISKAFGKTEFGQALIEVMKDGGFEPEFEAFNIFRPLEQRNLAPGQFDVMIGGKRKIFETTPELADAVNRLRGNAASTNLAFKMANAVTVVKKIGITFTPDFILKNVFRDQFTAGAFSEAGTIPFKDMAVAMSDIISKNDTYYNWMKSGGAGGAFLDLNKSFIENDLLGVSAESGMAGKVWNQVKKPAEYLQLAGTIMEEATRLAEFKKVTKGATEGAEVFKGGMASREVTVDFQRIGAKMAAINSITAFENVAVQGLDRTARAVKADPAGVLTKGMMYLTAPSILLWWANHDDERYKEIPRWEKDLFWIIPTNDWQPAKDSKEVDGMAKHLVRQKEDGSYEINKGHVYRLPKPQELGLIFGTIPERLMEKFFTDNPRALNDLSETVQGMLAPNLIPDAALPFIEQGINKNLFTSAPLVSPQMENRLPELQYTEYTTTTAKTLGKLIGMIPVAKDVGPNSTKISSPAVVDNYIKSWSGALGSYLVEVADKALEKSGVAPEQIKPSKTLADIPFIKAFVVRHPSGSTQSITDFYARSTEAEKIFNSIEFLKKQGDEEGIKKIVSNPDYQEAMVRTGEIKSALGQMSSVIKSIYANKEMTRDEKRQQIDSIYYMMIETAKQGNELMDDWAKNVKKQNK